MKSVKSVNQSIIRTNQPTNQTKALIAVEQNATVYNVESRPTIKTNSTQTVLIISEV